MLCDGCGEECETDNTHLGLLCDECYKLHEEEDLDGVHPRLPIS